MEVPTEQGLDLTSFMEEMRNHMRESRLETQMLREEITAKLQITNENIKKVEKNLGDFVVKFEATEQEVFTFGDRIVEMSKRIDEVSSKRSRNPSPPKNGEDEKTLKKPFGLSETQINQAMVDAVARQEAMLKRRELSRRQVQSLERGDTAKDGLEVELIEDFTGYDLMGRGNASSEGESLPPSFRDEEQKGRIEEGIQQWGEYYGGKMRTQRSRKYTSRRKDTWTLSGRKGLSIDSSTSWKKSEISNITMDKKSRVSSGLYRINSQKLLAKEIFEWRDSLGGNSKGCGRSSEDISSSS
jgi:hypothetical protein